MKYLIIMSLLFFQCAGSEEQVQEKLTNEQPINESVNYLAGKELFMEYCAACHNDNMRQDMTAPALGPVVEKRDSAWIRYYIRKGSIAAEEGDSIALSLRAEGWGYMLSYEHLTDQDVEDIILFIKEEYRKL